MTHVPPAAEPEDRGSPLTLADYAELIGCTEDELTLRGIIERSRAGVTAIRLPYLDGSGVEVAARYISRGTDGELKRAWKSDSTPTPFNRDALSEARSRGEVVLTTTEENALRFATAGIPALAIPALADWQTPWEALFDGIDRVVLVTTDIVSQWMLESALTERLEVLVLGEDALAAVRRAGRADFATAWATLRDQATPWGQRRREELAGEAGELISSPDVLAVLRADCAASGFAGDTRATELTYLVLHSRVLAKPASLAVKGPSSAGKNRAVEEALARFPQSAYIARTDLSAKALFYSNETFAHRTIVLLEAGKLKDFDMAGPLRQFLSEGKLVYEFTDFEAQGTRVIVKEGPTNLITTTTLVHLDPELETRMLSVTVSDTPKQTRLVLIAQALRYDTPDAPDHGRWQAHAEWIALGGREVNVPFASILAAMIDPAAVRLRRDFPSLLSLIETHVLLHQNTRDRDERGRVLAAITDYAQVHRLTADIVAEGAARSIRPPIRETVNAVSALAFGNLRPQDQAPSPVSINKLARQLGIDPSAARRRAYAAINAGYVQNTAAARRPPPAGRWCSRPTR
jgi:hypothetical protein